MSIHIDSNPLHSIQLTPIHLTLDPLDRLEHLATRLIDLIYLIACNLALAQLENNIAYLEGLLLQREITYREEEGQTNLDPVLEEDDSWSNQATPSSSAPHTPTSETLLDEHIDYLLEEVYSNWNEEDFWNLQYPLD